jgi:hypothetical protein
MQMCKSTPGARATHLTGYFLQPCLLPQLVSARLFQACTASTCIVPCTARLFAPYSPHKRFLQLSLLLARQHLTSSATHAISMHALPQRWAACALLNSQMLPAAMPLPQLKTTLAALHRIGTKVSMTTYSHRHMQAQALCTAHLTRASCSSAFSLSSSAPDSFSRARRAASAAFSPAQYTDAQAADFSAKA